MDDRFPTCPVCRLRFSSDAHLKDHLALDHPDFDEATRRDPASRGAEKEKSEDSSEGEQGTPSR